MITPFRKYEIIVEWVSDHGVLNSTKSMINLFNVKEWAACTNEAHNIKDNIPRTLITLENYEVIKARISYQEFDVVMNKFLQSYNLLDDESLQKAEVPDKYKYEGPVDVKFAEKNGVLATAITRQGFKPRDMEEAALHCLFSNITHMS